METTETEQTLEAEVQGLRTELLQGALHWLFETCLILLLLNTAQHCMQKNTLGLLSHECSMKLIPSPCEQPLSIKELKYTSINRKQEV